MACIKKIILTWSSSLSLIPMSLPRQKGRDASVKVYVLMLGLTLPKQQQMCGSLCFIWREGLPINMLLWQQAYPWTDYECLYSGIIQSLIDANHGQHLLWPGFKSRIRLGFWTRSRYLSRSIPLFPPHPQHRSMSYQHTLSFRFIIKKSDIVVFVISLHVLNVGGAVSESLATTSQKLSFIIGHCPGFLHWVWEVWDPRICYQTKLLLRMLAGGRHWNEVWSSKKLRVFKGERRIKS